MWLSPLHFNMCGHTLPRIFCIVRIICKKDLCCATNKNFLPTVAKESLAWSRHCLHGYGRFCAIIWSKSAIAQKFSGIAKLSNIFPPLFSLSTLREAPLEKSTDLFGHCPNSDCTPPTLRQTVTLGHFFRTDLSNFVKSPF